MFLTPEFGHDDSFTEPDSVCVESKGDYYSSSDSEFEVAIPGNVSNSFQDIVADSDQPAAGNASSERRSSRSRRRPERYGEATSYDGDVPFDGEADTVENYWPNYPRGTWTPDNS